MDKQLLINGCPADRAYNSIQRLSIEKTMTGEVKRNGCGKAESYQINEIGWKNPTGRFHPS
jgi:hypothetical protein